MPNDSSSGWASTDKMTGLSFDMSNLRVGLYARFKSWIGFLTCVLDEASIINKSKIFSTNNGWNHEKLDCDRRAISWLVVRIFVPLPGVGLVVVSPVPACAGPQHAGLSGRPARGRFWLQPRTPQSRGSGGITFPPARLQNARKSFRSGPAGATSDCTRFLFTVV